MKRGLFAVPVLALALPATALGLSGSGLRQVQCLSPARGCTRAVAISRATGVALSPDGRSVYIRSGVGALGSLGVFARDRRSGKLRQVQCVARHAKPCADGRGLETPSALAVSPNGRSVYVTAQNGRSVGIYRRLARGKLVSRGSVARLAHPQAVAVSPDGRNVYVGGDRLWVFARATSGALRLVEREPGATQALAVAPDGAEVYAGSGGGTHGSLALYTRDAATGALEKTADANVPGIEQPAQIVASGSSLFVVATVSGAVTRFDGTLETGIARGLPGAFGLAVTPARVYVAYRDGVAVLTRRLKRLGTARLASAATGVAAAGRHVYAASSGRVTAFAAG